MSRTDSKLIQGHGTGLYRETDTYRMLEYVGVIQKVIVSNYAKNVVVKMIFTIWLKGKAEDVKIGQTSTLPGSGLILNKRAMMTLGRSPEYHWNQN